MQSADVLAPNEGALILRVHSRYYNTAIELEKESGEGPSRIRAPEFDGGMQTLVIRLPEGKYSWRRIHAGGVVITVDHRDRRIFEVAPGILGYGGDLYISGNEMGTKATYYWADEQSSVESYLRSIAPEILDRYSIDYAAMD